MSADSQPTGTQPLQAPLGHFDSLAFIIQQALSKVQTATVVRVEKCTNSGGLEPVGFVDVTPLVNQVDNEGNAVPHVTIFGMPYCRIQGGANAVIIDPEPGDTGIAVFASRDISKVKATKDQANPGSFRQFNFADGMYIGGLLNAEPSQYIQFNAAGIKVYSPAKVHVVAPVVVIDASASTTINTPTLTVNGDTLLNGSLNQGNGSRGGAANMLGPLNVTNDVTGQGTSLHTHVHGGVTPGGGETGEPV